MPKTAGSRVLAPGETRLLVYTSSTSWTKPNGVRAVLVTVVGGGGGGGSITNAGGGVTQAASADGCGGGLSQMLILAADLGSSETVTVGALGAGGTGGGSGGTGGTSSFGSHCSATGGQGGSPAASTSGDQTVFSGTPGTGSGGDMNLTGGQGTPGQTLGGKYLWHTGGGSSPLGFGIGGTPSTVAANAAGKGFGAGGGGVVGQSVNTDGGAGTKGVVYVLEIF